MSIYALKGRFQDLLRPLVRWLHGRGVTANEVTVFAALVSVAVAVVVGMYGDSHRWVFVLLPAWMLERMALNAVDGMLAREFGQQSRLGAYLNELGDVVADSALFLCLLAVPGMTWPPLVALVIGAALTETAGVLGLMVGAQRRYDGPMGKSDRAFVVGVLGLLLSLGLVDARAVAWAAWAMAALCAVTVVRRVRAGLAQATMPAETASGTIR